MLPAVDDDDGKMWTKKISKKKNEGKALNSQKKNIFMAFILIMLMCFGIGMENEGERKEIYDKKRKGTQNS